MKGSKGVKLVGALGLVAILALGGFAKVHAAPADELRVATSGFADEKFEPKRIGVTTQGIVAPMYDWLFGLDRNGNLAPGIVEKWEMAQDGLSWTLRVRKGVKFHNGDDLTARDVAFTYEGYASKDARTTFVRDMVDHVEIADAYTVRIYTKGFQIYLPYMSSMLSPAQGLVSPKDYIEKNGSEHFEQHPIGSGPFKFVRHVSGDMIEYEALNKHWKQTPAFKTLKMLLMPEESTRVAALKTGEVDVIDIGLESAKNLDAAGFRTFALSSTLATVCLYGTYMPEAAKMPTADIRVRQALSLAINRDEIRKNLFYGKAGPPTAPTLHGKVTDIDIAYWSKYAAKAFRYDLNEARRLLKEAGYPDGFSMKLFSWSTADSAYLPKLAEVIQAYWGKIGVKAEIVPVDSSQFSKMRTAGKDTTPVPELMGQAGMYANSEAPITPRQLRVFFDSKGRSALVGKAMPELDQLTLDAFSERDPKKRKEMLSKATKMATDSYTALVICTVPSMVALGPRVDINFPNPAPVLGYFLDIAKHRKQ